MLSMLMLCLSCHARQLHRLPRCIQDMSETIWTEMCPAIPSCHDHENILDIHDLQKMTKSRSRL